MGFRIGICKFQSYEKPVGKFTFAINPARQLMLFFKFEKERLLTSKMGCANFSSKKELPVLFAGHRFLLGSPGNLFYNGTRCLPQVEGCQLEGFRFSSFADVICE